MSRLLGIQVQQNNEIIALLTSLLEVQKAEYALHRWELKLPIEDDSRPPAGT